MIHSLPAKLFPNGSWIVAMSLSVAVPGCVTSALGDVADPYKAVWDHNIFLRDRAARMDQNIVSEPTKRSLEQEFVITGIVFEKDLFRARIEDIRDGSMMTKHAGEPLARGRIVSIRLENIVYEGEDGVQAAVFPGCNLQGLRMTGKQNVGR